MQMQFIELDENEWTNADTIQTIGFISGAGEFVVTFKSGGSTTFPPNSFGAKALKKFLGQ
jgi:hypothetical protein